MTGMTKTADYLRACEVAKRVIDAWDPYALLAQGAPSDEFEGCAAKVVTYVPRIRTPEDATNALSRVFSEAFEPELFQPDHCREVGAALFSALAQAGLLSQRAEP
jgi:hypothetical protein